MLLLSVPLAELPGATLVMLLFLMLVVGFTLLRTYRKLGTRPQYDIPYQNREVIGQRPFSTATDTDEAVRKVGVEILELARDAKAEIDTKLVALGQMIREAEYQADRLEAAVRASRCDDEGQDRPAVARTSERRSPDH